MSERRTKRRSLINFDGMGASWLVKEGGLLMQTRQKRSVKQNNLLRVAQQTDVGITTSELL